MEKTEALNKLKKSGYQVQFDSSVVTVVLPVGSNTTQEIKKLKAFLAQIGYDASFGIRQEKGKSVKKKEGLTEPEEQKETEFMEIGEQFSLEDFGIS